MFRPSVSSMISGLFLAYISNSIWSVLRLYFPPTCESDKLCLTNFLVKNPEILFLFLSSTKSQPTVDGDLNYLGHLDLLNPSSAEPVSHQISLNLPKAVTHRNGSLYLAIFSLPLPKDASQLSYRKKWAELIRHPDATYTLEKLTAHQIPEAKAFNLLQRDDEKPEVSHSKVVDAPVVHVKTKIFIGIMVDDVDIPSVGIPGEIYHLIKLREPERKSYLPIVYVDELSHRLADLRLVNSTDSSTEISVIYRSFGWGKLRMLLQFSSAMHSMKGLGFNDKDLDEVKGIFADTNVVLLLVTMAVSAVHLLFDFLAFKNDVEFWKGRTNMTGLSTRTLLWRAFSQTVIFFYLLEEKTSMLVLVPSAIAAVIEIWKVRKAFGFSFRKGGIYRKFGGGDDDKAEKYTERLDSQAMKYLARVLYPLLTGGAVYSLLYMPHKSWRSWTMQSLVNAVYAFGFLFMLPQLFVNYRLKSVAHLPWRAFAYKAFNTFIDDLFAFIITMPTAHRVACLRDDVVFVIYLYQRYLYPVDKNRVDLSGMIDETVDDDVQRSQNVISPEKGSTPKKKVD